MAAQGAEIRRLKERPVVKSTPASGRHEGADDEVSPVSRRWLLTTGAAGVAVGGAVAVMGGASPASAAAGDNMILGQANDAGSSGTGLTSTGTSVTPTLDVTSTAANANVAIRGTVVASADLLNSACVLGDTNTAGVPGVGGASLEYYGVQAATTSTYAAVFGDNRSTAAVGGPGVEGQSSNSYGVYGHAGNAVAGVLGYNNGFPSGGPGVEGTSTSGNGVFGQTPSGFAAVLGSNTNDGAAGGGAGVQGQSSFGPGVVGIVGTGPGVLATDEFTGTGVGVVAALSNGSNSSPAIRATTAGSGPALLAESNGLGIQAAGQVAPLLLVPATTAGHPTTGNHSKGEIYVDSNGVIYSCVSAGSPGTWTKISPLIPVNPPARAYDLRSHDGPLDSDSTRNVSLTPGHVPGGASLALINLTIVDTVGSGFLTLYAEGTSAPSPLTSNINWYASHQIIANNATTAVGSTGEVTLLARGTGSTQFIIDVFGYYL